MSSRANLPTPKHAVAMKTRWYGAGAGSVLLRRGEIAPVRTSRIDSARLLSYADSTVAYMGRTSPDIYRVYPELDRSASSAPVNIHSLFPVHLLEVLAPRGARRNAMTRSALGAVAQEFFTQAQSTTEDAQPHESKREHKLPFNTDSPDWTPEGRTREAAELRMTQLVKTLESEVIPRLLEAHRASPTGLLPLVSLCPPPTAQDVSDFVQLVLHSADLQIHDCISDIRQKGMSVEMVYLDLLAPSAKCMGDLWMDDRCDFTEVTVGLGRLQLLLQELGPAFGGEVKFPANARRVLLMPAPGDHHTFGLSMVAEFFGRSGWEVASGNVTSPTNAVDMARAEWFDVIGFSVGNETRLDWLKDCITTVRQVSRNKNVGVMVGGPVFLENPELVQTVGADCTAVDAKDAPIQAEILIGQSVLSR